MNYREVAVTLGEKVEALWDVREGSMEVYTEARWVPWLVEKAWREHIPAKITIPDWKQILLEGVGVLDCNIWSQIYLNSPLSILPTYDITTMRGELDRLRGIFQDCDPSPFAPKAKMTEDHGSDWNKALMLMAALRILDTAPTYTTWKIYSRSQTPALSDSAGFGRINSALDSYILFPKGAHKRVFPDPLFGSPQDGKLTLSGHKVAYESKSGNWDNLLGVMSIRQAMVDIYSQCGGNCLLLPRHTCLSVIYQ